MKKPNQALKPEENKPAFPMRINKYLAVQKHSTRRGADDLIKDGKVFINGRLAVLGDKVMEKDVVDVRYRGKQKPYIYIAYNKPKEIVTHSAQKGEKAASPEVAKAARTMSVKSVKDFAKTKLSKLPRKKKSYSRMA
jgi:16S rRNA U516 pseudouridylate synthase RsuA-like enzyme